ncbi:CusA/CzcA family heavy metal efflux RND transporter [Pedobacter sp. SL55]|uniref:CusA/CzcA family heavy metal efflux RND transporter n=1 Tax=Pedobacter sp. SL55 TaxID=2995161 RepID=UPI002270B5D4|nr:CusA/CzcA family heavy metal efflux RND transporter [Pedobacter sp. SL55]WAC39662.1 CusA/CzcA family heavy metal efflux RND transporter [Pedobacter sp. SL55]
MLNKIIEFAIKNKLIVGLFTIALIIYGSFELTKLPIDAVPDITNNQVQIITTAPSYGATDIERLVTFPVEQANSNIAGIKEIRSYSRFGLSLVTLVFNDDVDVYWARQQVAERLLVVQEQIPKGIGKPEMGPISTGLGEIYQYAVKPKKGYEKRYDITELRTIQDWVVRRQLLGVKGVAEVSSFGGKLKQYQVTIDPNKLVANKVTIAEIFDALENNNQNTGGAYIEKQASVLYIRSEGLIGTKEDIENVVVRTSENSTPLLIRDVANVEIGAATRYGALTFNNEGEVSGAIVMMLKGANSNVVIDNIKAKIAQIAETLPEGVEIVPFLDRTSMVNNAIKTVETNLLEGALIVVFVLVIFLGNLRAGFIVASVIPLSMLFAIIMMNIFGVSGNLMSLGALDFGLIVDGAVIIVEAVMHQLGHSKRFAGISFLKQDQMDLEVKSASSKMMNSAVFGQIIILIVYLPIFSLQGIEGKMFKPMAQTVAFALLGAFILSLTYIPMMSSLFLSKKIKTEPNISDKAMARVENRYERLLQKVLGFPKTVLAIVLGLFVTAVVILANLGGEFIPSIEEGDFAVETRVLSGSNLNTTIENVQKVAGILKERFPEVKNIVTKIGSSEVPTEPLPMDMGDMIINLKPKSEWTSAKSFDELAEKMGEASSEIPGVTTSFQFPVQMRFNELMTGARQDVVCKIFGEDFDTLALYAKKLGNLVRTVNGATEMYVEQITGTPQIVIQYNRATIAQYGLNIADINRNVNTAFAGQSTGLVFEGEKRFDLVVRLQNDKRQDIKDVQNLLIPTSDGNQIPLSQVADVALVNSPSQIQREDTKRRILVGFNVSGRDVESIVTELQEKVKAEIKLPTGYTITYGGSFENLNEAKSRLMVAVPVSLVLIFLLLYFAFGSIKYGLLIYTAIPLSAIGGIFLLALRGLPFSISAGVGFIALFGIAVLNGIVLVAEFNNIKKTGEQDMKKVVLKGTKTRLRPVLMTAFVASLGFLPMAISNGAGASVQRPLATVVIGGLMIATLLTLFVLPILYVSFEKGLLRRKKTPKIVTMILLLLGFGISSANAQQPITLSATLDSLYKNNISLKSAQLKADYSQQLSKTATTIAPLNINGEYGKYNSNLMDNKLSVNQSFSLPNVYARQKDKFLAEWKTSLLQRELSKADLTKLTTQVFYDLLAVEQLQKLYLDADSAYQKLKQLAELRLKTGESSLLEKASANNQILQLNTKLSNLEVEALVLQQQLAFLLNTNAVLKPQAESLKAKPTFADTLAWANHPLIKLQQQEEKTAEATTKMEQAKLLPEFNVGYNSTTLRDDIRFKQSDRFQSFQLGLSIPLFGGSQRNRVKSAKFDEAYRKSETANASKQISSSLKSAYAQYQAQLSLVESLEKDGLKTAKEITSTLDKQLQNGAINYLEWTMLNNQAIEMKASYFEAIKQLNRSITELNYLLTQ